MNLKRINQRFIEKKAKNRIKVGLILNEFGEQNNIKVNRTRNSSTEIQKQLRMMPGQEKIVMDYYQKNPSAATQALQEELFMKKKLSNLIKIKKSKVSKKKN